jgi:hypothetical protein
MLGFELKAYHIWQMLYHWAPAPAPAELS